MKNIFYDIQNYILFLRKKGYYVSFSNFGDRFHPYTEQLLQHEIHLHSVCSYLKSNPATIGMCVCQKATLSKCKIKKTVYSCCYAGVEEYIVPLYQNNERIICIHVSGYRNNLKRSHRLSKNISNQCSSIFDELYLQLSQDKPSVNTLESFIKPLEYMLTVLYDNCQNAIKHQKPLTQTEQIYFRCLEYINDNYMNNISAETIATKMQYSASYIRALFKKIGGCSLQNKINDIRLENAKFMLLNTSLSVTEIAYHCGFSDSNYFSTAFKKKFSVSPLNIRKL